jgi:Uma2 family endonuclease
MSERAKVRCSLPLRPAEPARRRLTADDLLAMEEAGILHPEEKVELIDRAIITMAAKSPRHDDMCAAHGAREYWLVDARRMITHVHRDPGATGYASVCEAPADVCIAPPLPPSLALRLADLGPAPLAGDAGTSKTT